jgi:hypothetical protein
MSACNILFQKQHKAVHMMVDGAGYDANGVVLSISQKAFALPTLHAAVSSLGIGLAGHLFAIHLERRFSSFDDMVERIEAVAPEIYESLLNSVDVAITDVALTIIGWSQAEDGPAAYTLRMNEPDKETEIGERDARHSAEFGSDSAAGGGAFELVRCDFSTINPPPVAMLNELAFPDYKFVDDLGEVAIPEIDLLHILEAQRRRKFATRPGCEEAHKVGGLALLTSITRDGVSQKVVHRWTEDRIGELISPLPIDWKAWRAARTVAAAGIDLSGLSRLQRERMEKKARKGTLRSV